MPHRPALVFALAALIAMAPMPSLAQSGRGAALPNAGRLKAQGDELRQKGELAQAIEKYQAALEADPAHAATLQDLAQLFYGEGRFAEAAELFGRLARVEPSEVVALYNEAYSLRKARRYEDAAARYRDYIKASPDDPDGYFGLAECLRALGRQEDAAAQYELYVKKEFRPAEQEWVERAKSRAEGLREAVAAAKKAAEQRAMAQAAPPAPTPAPVQTPVPATEESPRTETAAATAPEQAPPAPAPTPTVRPAAQPAEPTPAAEQIAAAEPAPEPAAQPARTRNPAAAISRIREGDQMFQQRRYKDAQAAYEEAHKLDDQSTNALLKLGLALANQNDYQGAVDRWEQVLQLDPGNKYAKGYIDRARPRLAEAPAPRGPQPIAAETSTAKASAPAAPVPAQAPTAPPKAAVDEAGAQEAFARAVKLINTGRFVEALPDLNNAIEKNPRFVSAYVARGGAHLGMRRYREAVGDYQKALQLDPNTATPLYGLARSYEALGDKVSAVTFYRRYAASNARDVRVDLKQKAAERANALAQ